jgi:hypothetical protein
MNIRGYVTKSEQKPNTWTDRDGVIRNDPKTLFQIEGLRLNWATKQDPPPVGTEIDAAISVKWHPGKDGKDDWSTIEVAGFRYVQ